MKIARAAEWGECLKDIRTRIFRGRHTSLPQSDERLLVLKRYTLSPKKNGTLSIKAYEFWRSPSERARLPKTSSV